LDGWAKEFSEVCEGGFDVEFTCTCDDAFACGFLDDLETWVGVGEFGEGFDEDGKVGDVWEG